MKYWLYMKEDYRIGAESLDLRSVTFRRDSYYSGEPLKYLVVPGRIKGQIMDLSDEAVSKIQEEVSTSFINPHPVRDGAFTVNQDKKGVPLGELLTLMPLDRAHERGYLHYPSVDPFETLA